MADEGLYVVVTFAPNGIVHAWGDGPVIDTKGDQVLPFTTRADARREAARLRQLDTEHRLTRDPDQDGEQEPILVRVCKLLGTTPVPVD